MSAGLPDTGKTSPTREMGETQSSSPNGLSKIKRQSELEVFARQSLLRYSPAMMLVIIAIADAGRLADTDLWGHIVFGRGILSSGHLTRIDPYSYSAAGHLWN